MYYLYVKTRSANSDESESCRLSPVHGPFATPHEARGFFTKLQLWYPMVMHQAEYEVIERDAGSRTARARSIPS